MEWTGHGQEAEEHIQETEPSGNGMRAPWGLLCDHQPTPQLQSVINGSPNGCIRKGVLMQLSMTYADESMQNPKIDFLFCSAFCFSSTPVVR